MRKILPVIAGFEDERGDKPLKARNSKKTDSILEPPE